MSNRNYVKLVFLDKESLSSYGPELAKLSFVLTNEWASVMSGVVSDLVKRSDELNKLPDDEIVDILDSASKAVIQSIATGLQTGSGNNMQVVSIVINNIRQSINNAEEMSDVLGSRTIGVSPAIALQHNYPFILMKTGKTADIEYSLHFDLNEFETFFVKENNLSDVVEALEGFPISVEDREALLGEDFYASLNAANDDTYDVVDTDSSEDLPSMFKVFENMHLGHMASDTGYDDRVNLVDTYNETVPQKDSLVEETNEIEYSARVYTIFGELEDERTGHSGQLEDLIAWASSLAKLDGLRYDIHRVVTTTRVTVSEELVS